MVAIVSGVTAVLFVVMAMAILFLSFQVFDNNHQCRETRTSHQRTIQDAARLAIQSTTQEDDFYANENITKAKLYLDTVVQSYPSAEAAEKALKLTKGHLTQLRQRVDGQYDAMQKYLRQITLEVHPRFKVEDEVVNKAAGFDSDTPVEPRKVRQARRQTSDSKTDKNSR